MPLNGEVARGGRGHEVEASVRDELLAVCATTEPHGLLSDDEVLAGLLSASGCAIDDACQQEVQCLERFAEDRESTLCQPPSEVAPCLDFYEIEDSLWTCPDSLIEQHEYTAVPEIDHCGLSDEATRQQDLVVAQQPGALRFERATQLYVGKAIRNLRP
ncbi:MAG: hypothetical protein ACJAYU_000466 [Bradymonadia bacterium]|jgi:hypothetical protein